MARLLYILLPLLRCHAVDIADFSQAASAIRLLLLMSSPLSAICRFAERVSRCLRYAA